MPCVLLRGNPEPLQETTPPLDIEQPATFKLAASTGTPEACRSAMALGMLSAQSAEAKDAAVQFAGVPADRVIGAMEGLVIPPKELPTL